MIWKKEHAKSNRNVHRKSQNLSSSTWSLPGRSNGKTGLHAVLEATDPIQSCKSIRKFITEFITNSPTFRVLWVFFGSLRRFLFVLRSKLILHRLCHSSDDIPREMHPGKQLRRNLRGNFKALKTDPIARPWAWSAHPFAKHCETKKTLHFLWFPS